jgi:DNA repair protein RadB
MKRLPTGCKPLDELLRGGIECGAVTQIYGEPGCGKTTLCLQLACNCVIEGKKAVYIDTESVSMERLEQIGGPDLKYSDILFSRPYSLDEQEKLVRNAVKVSGAGIVIVDTINMYHRLKYHEAPDECKAPMLRQLETLSVAALQNEFPVIITAQVYQSKEDGQVRAFGGKDMAYLAKTILHIERLAPGKRRATIIKHRSIHDSQSVEFRLTNKGAE